MHKIYTVLVYFLDGLSSRTTMEGSEERRKQQPTF